jgi:hypothetical protein
MPGTDHVST